MSTDPMTTPPTTQPEGERPIGRCIGCFHDFNTGPCGGCGAVDHAPERPTDIDWILDLIRIEVRRARAKFPYPNPNMLALMEEVGELSKALMDEPAYNAVEEAIQVACVAIRVALEGDPAVTDLRSRKGLDALGDPS